MGIHSHLFSSPYSHFYSFLLIFTHFSSFTPPFFCSNYFFYHFIHSHLFSYPYSHFSSPHPTFFIIFIIFIIFYLIFISFFTGISRNFHPSHLFFFYIISFTIYTFSPI